MGRRRRGHRFCCKTRAATRQTLVGHREPLLSARRRERHRQFSASEPLDSKPITTRSDSGGGDDSGDGGGGAIELRRCARARCATRSLKFSCAAARGTRSRRRLDETALTLATLDAAAIEEPPTAIGGSLPTEKRHVRIVKHEAGLGISVQGGADNGRPIVIR